MSNVLVIAPHPDDEAIGCGGTLLLHARRGDNVHIIFLTSGEGGGHGLADAGKVREKEAGIASEILHVKGSDFWRGRDGKVRVTRSLVDRTVETLDRLRPDLVYVTHRDEMHPDHRAAFRLLQRALADERTNSVSPEVWGYEVWTPLRAIGHIVDVSDVMDEKLKAVRAYESQCSVMRFDDTIRGLNRYRGEMHSWPGGDYAEVFTAAAPGRDGS